MRGYLITIFLLITFVLAPVSEAKNLDIVKVTFIHYTSPHSKPIWDDTEDDYRLIMGGIRLPTTVTFYIYNIPPTLDKDSVITMLGKSAETWDKITEKELFDTSWIGETVYAPGNRDGINSIGWNLLDINIIAVTNLWVNVRTKEIVEFDITFNTYYNWYDCTEIICEERVRGMDLQNIATHEFGHSIGLDDLRPPKDHALTMYGYSSYGETQKRSLGIGDILGAQKLYGAA